MSYLAKVTFNVTGRGNTKLTLKATLADKPSPGGVASSIPHTVIDGFFGPIHVFVSPTMVKVGEEVNISGFIVPAEENVKIRVKYRHQGEMSWHSLANVTTNQQGNYLYVWQPQEEGKKANIRLRQSPLWKAMKKQVAQFLSRWKR